MHYINLVLFSIYFLLNSAKREKTERGNPRGDLEFSHVNYFFVLFITFHQSPSYSCVAKCVKQKNDHRKPSRSLRIISCPSFFCPVWYFQSNHSHCWIVKCLNETIGHRNHRVIVEFSAVHHFFMLFDSCQ